jgi:hypothetical protein
MLSMRSSAVSLTPIALPFCLFTMPISGKWQWKLAQTRGNEDVNWSPPSNFHFILIGEFICREFFLIRWSFWVCLRWRTKLKKLWRNRNFTRYSGENHQFKWNNRSWIWIDWRTVWVFSYQNSQLVGDFKEVRAVCISNVFRRPSFQLQLPIEYTLAYIIWIWYQSIKDASNPGVYGPRHFVSLSVHFTSPSP